ncbi:MAG: 1-acyl-sn-glycerol-3-phosphate acyltransferase [Spirochaetales bacterium]|nr:1-acyl-sn-glycerol-3-phosphate acyltransferase [Spirochaetales bacterium]
MARYGTVRAFWKTIIFLNKKKWLSSGNVNFEWLSAPPSGSFILLANHSHAKDPWVIGSIVGTPVRYMANIEGVSPISAFFSDLVGAFGKRKGMPDLQSLKTAMTYLRQGEPVGIFPEGDRSWDGRTQDFNDSVIRIAKTTKASLLLVRQEGSFLTHPRWAENPRKGKWLIQFKTIDRREFETRTTDDIYAQAKEFLTVDDIKLTQTKNLTFTSHAPAQGITRVLWRCPDCEVMASFEESDESITCSSCGSGWTVNGNCILTYQAGSSSAESTFPRQVSLTQWIDWQKERLSTDQRTDELRFAIENLVRIEPGPTKSFGSCALVLSLQSMVLKGEAEWVFDLSEIEGFVDNFNNHSAFTYRGQRWKLIQGSFPAHLIQTLIRERGTI